MFGGTGASAVAGVFHYMNRAKRALCGLFCLCLVALFAGSVRADECAGALPAGSATGCGAVISVTSANGAGVATAFSVTTPVNGNPFDGTEDTLVGLVNNTGVTLNSITLSSPDESQGGLGFFDDDGVCTFNSADCFGPFGYEGPNMTFSGNCLGNDPCDSVTITFTGGLAAGASTWFSLEGTPDSLAGVQPGATPEPGSLLLLGTGLLGLGLAVVRRHA